MEASILKVDEKKVYIDLFNIYEQEFLQILDYIAPINNICNIEGCKCGCKINLNVSGNKIHELHLRVCSECENLMKSIIKKLSPDIDLDSEYLKVKHEDICSIISNLGEKQKKLILEKLNKHADMPFCLNILHNELGICDKIIEFAKIIEVNPDNQIIYIQPFERNNATKYFPLWWEHYNQIKHNKINSYTNCTLRDLINSLGAYYMLLNYFILPLKLPVYDNTRVHSKIYRPTVGRIDYPDSVRNIFRFFRDDRTGNFFEKIMHNGKEIIPSEYDDKTMEFLKPLMEEAERKHILIDKISGKGSSYFKTENYFFYKLLEQYNLTHGFKDNQFEKDSVRKLLVQTKLNV